MPRRRRILLGLAIAIPCLLVASYFLLHPPPPFKFLQNAKLRYVSVNVEEGKRLSDTSYFVNGDPKTISRIAGTECLGWIRSVSPQLDSVEFTHGDRRLTIVGWNFGTTSEPMTHVLYERPAGFVDELRSPAYRVASWLPW